MAVYLFTFHAYRSWLPSHRRGYVQRHKGILPPDAQMSDIYVRRARFDAVRFTPAMAQLIIERTQQVCRQYDWRCHCITVVWSHVHVLLSWRGFRAFESVRAILKRELTRGLRESINNPAQPFFSRSSSRRRITDHRHFDHLMKTYLPAHRKYRGICWTESPPAVT